MFIYLDDGRKVVVFLHVCNLKTQDVRLSLRAGVPDHVTLEIISLLRR